MALGWRGQYQRYREFYLNIQALYKQRADLRAFLEIVLSMSTIIIFLVFALKPTALTIISLYGQIQEKQKTAANLSQKLKDLQVANSAFTKYQNAIPHIDASVSNSPQPNVVVQQIQAIASKDSISILGISFGDIFLSGNASTKKASLDLPPLPNGAREMSISISARGDYSSINSFLKDLESLRTIVNLDTFSVSSSETEQGKTIVTIISGRVPYLNQ